MHRQSPSLRDWLTVATGALFFFFQFIQMSIFNTLSPALLEEFQLSTTTLGYLSSLFLVAVVIFAIPAGLLTDRFSPKRLILANLLLSISGVVMMGLASGLGVFALGRALTGLAHAFCFLACLKLTSQHFAHTSSMALASGMVVTIGMLGGTVAQAPMLFMIETQGWHQALLSTAGLGVIISLLILMIVQEQPINSAHRKESYWDNLCLVAKQPANWLASAYTGFLNLPIIVLGALWGSLFLHHVHAVSATDATRICGFLFLGTIVASPLVGWLSDRLENRTLPMQVGAYTSLVLLLIIISGHPLSSTQLTWLFFLLGASSSTQILAYPLIAESNPSHLGGSANSIATIVIMSIGMIFQPVIGTLLDFGRSVHHMETYSALDYQWAFLLIAASFPIASFCCAKIRPRVEDLPEITKIPD